MRALAVALLVTLGVTLGPVTVARAGTPAAGYTDTLAINGLSFPTGAAFLPDGRLLVIEKGGAVKLQIGATTFTSTLVTIPVCTGSEMGLLGIALDPSFAANGFVYLYRTENAGGCAGSANRFNEVVRVTMAPDDTIDIGSLTVLLTGIRTDFGNHDGGALRVGPDGTLYVGVGDTGRGDNLGCPGTATNPYAQDLNALEGKILRLNLDGTIPADNPFVGVPGVREEIFASGFRNPWRMDFDPSTGSLWVGEVGDFAFEEVDIVTAGGNYGWPQCEGTNHPAGCGLGGEIDPIFEYAHGGSCPGEGALPDLGSSITGGSFAGVAFGALAGHYVFADYTRANVYLAIVNGARTDVVGTPTVISSSAQGPVDVITGPDGAIYYASITGGQIRRLAPDTPDPEQELFGTKLTLKVGTDPTKKSASFVAKDAGITLGAGNGSADDPVLNGGSVRIRTTAGCAGPCDTTYALGNTLPDETWKYVGLSGQNRGYKYKSKLTKFRAAIAPGKRLRVSLKGALGHGLDADPQPVDASLTIGGHTYCVQFGGTTTFTAGKRFSAKNATAPGACPP